MNCNWEPTNCRSTLGPSPPSTTSTSTLTLLLSSWNAQIVYTPVEIVTGAKIIPTWCQKPPKLALRTGHHVLRPLVHPHNGSSNRITSLHTLFLKENAIGKLTPSVTMPLTILSASSKKANIGSLFANQCG